MTFNDFFVGEIAMELLKQLIAISRKSCLCKSSADSLITSIQELLPIIDEIKYSGVELSALRQSQLDRFSETLRDGLELARKVLASSRWNVYKNHQLARKMEKLEKQVSRFVSGPMQAHLLADVHHMRFETMNRFDRLEGRLEQRLNSMKIGTGGWVEEEAVKRTEVEGEASFGILGGVGLDSGKSKVKQMIIGRDDLNIVGIRGIEGSGKTTLASEICRDNQVRRNDAMGYTNNLFVPQWKIQCEWGSRPLTMVVLDDIWSLSVLEQLIFRIPTDKTLVVSRFKFPTSVVNKVYKVELLMEDESMLLFCQSAFGQKSIPPTANETLVKQIVNE